MEDEEDLEIPDYLKNEYVKKIVKIILNNSSSKIPIKRADIISNAVGGNTRLFNEVFSRAKKKMMKLYGLAVHQVPETKSTKTYITISTLGCSSILEYTDSQKREHILLFLVLSYIFMKDERVNEEILFSYLKKLRIPLEDPNENFPFLVKKVITETYVKQLYLKREKIQSITSNESEFYLSWGYRAILEFPKKKMLEVVANILQKPTLCFVRQHSEVTQIEEDMDVE